MTHPSMARLDTVKLLQAAFTPEEWQILSNNCAFKSELAADEGTMESYETLVQVGVMLLKENGAFGEDI